VVDAEVTFSLASAGVADHDVPEWAVDELTGGLFRIDGGVEAVFAQPQSEVQAADAAAHDADSFHGDRFSRAEGRSV
jgi:hypothetical protein